MSALPETDAVVTVRLDGQVLAVDLALVAEVVRLAPLTPLPGGSGLAGVLDLRGSPLPVRDARRRRRGAPTGVVLVLRAAGAEAVGVLVDEVLEVVPAQLLPVGHGGAGLPPWVLDVRTSPAGPVPRVDLVALLDGAQGVDGADGLDRVDLDGVDLDGDDRDG